MASVRLAKLVGIRAQGFRSGFATKYKKDFNFYKIEILQIGNF
jgi:hypothetical protein